MVSYPGVHSLANTTLDLATNVSSSLLLRFQVPPIVRPRPCMLLFVSFVSCHFHSYLVGLKEELEYIVPRLLGHPNTYTGGNKCAHCLSLVHLVLSLECIFSVGGVEIYWRDAQSLGQEYLLPGVGTPPHHNSVKLN